MKKVLCPTDFSNKSLDVYRFASNFALSLSADLILFHASTEPLEQSDNMRFKNVKDLPEGIEESNRTLIETWQSLKNSEGKEGRRSHFDFVMEEGFPLASIVRFVEKNAIDLVVMHTKTEQNKDHEGVVYIGSIGAQVVEDVKCPVLLVPQGTIYDNMQKMVYAIDLDSYCEECIEKAMIFAKGFNAKVMFLYMGDAQHKKLDQVRSLIENKFEKGLASIEVKQEKDFIVGINSFIKSNNIDMLIMERHRKNILEKLFSKSLINAVEKHAETPLLILPAK
jgi:nucleotide-binding universal stress UspA family protein